MTKDKSFTQERSGYLTAFLIYIIVLYSGGLAFSIYWMATHPDDFFKYPAPFHSVWATYYSHAAILLNVVAAIAVLRWKKWGVHLMVLNLCCLSIFSIGQGWVWPSVLRIAETIFAAILTRPLLKGSDQL